MFEPFLFAVRCNLPINFAHRYLIGAGAGNESSRCFLLHFESTRIDSREIFFALCSPLAACWLIHELLVLGFSHPDDLGIIHEDRDASAAPHPRTCSLSFFPSMAMDITVSEYYGRVLIDT